MKKDMDSTLRTKSYAAVRGKRYSVAPNRAAWNFYKKARNGVSWVSIGRVILPWTITEEEMLSQAHVLDEQAKPLLIKPRRGRPILNKASLTK